MHNDSLKVSYHNFSCHLKRQVLLQTLLCSWQHLHTFLTEETKKILPYQVYNHTTSIIMLFPLMPGQAMVWLVANETSEQEIARGLNALTDANVLPLTILHLQMLTLCNFNKLWEPKAHRFSFPPTGLLCNQKQSSSKVFNSGHSSKIQGPVVQRLNIAQSSR